jgi:hypothetical protein
VERRQNHQPGVLPGTASSNAISINNAGQAVGFSQGSSTFATEWSGGKIINLGALPGAIFSEALGINNAGQAVGFSIVGGVEIATEWSGGIGGSIIKLGGLPGSTLSQALSINDSGQAVGLSVVGGTEIATEWSGDSVINLRGPARLPRLALPPTSTTPGRWWDLALSAGSKSPPNGAATAPSSSWDRALPPASTTPGRSRFDGGMAPAQPRPSRRGIAAPPFQRQGGKSQCNFTHRFGRYLIIRSLPYHIDADELWSTGDATTGRVGNRDHDRLIR